MEVNGRSYQVQPNHNCTLKHHLDLENEMILLILFCSGLLRCIVAKGRTDAWLCLFWRPRGHGVETFAVNIFENNLF